MTLAAFQLWSHSLCLGFKLNAILYVLPRFSVRVYLSHTDSMCWEQGLVLQGLFGYEVGNPWPLTSWGQTQEGAREDTRPASVHRTPVLY